MMGRALMQYGIKQLVIRRENDLRVQVSLYMKWQAEQELGLDTTAETLEQVEELERSIRRLTARIEARRAYMAPKAVRERAKRWMAETYVPDICLSDLQT